MLDLLRDIILNGFEFPDHFPPGMMGQRISNSKMCYRVDIAPDCTTA